MPGSMGVRLHPKLPLHAGGGGQVEHLERKANRGFVSESPRYHGLGTGGVTRGLKYLRAECDVRELTESL